MFGQVCGSTLVNPRRDLRAIKEITMTERKRGNYTDRAGARCESEELHESSVSEKRVRKQTRVDI